MNYEKQFFINLVHKLQNNNPYFVKKIITVYHAVSFFHFKISLMMNLHFEHSSGEDNYDLYKLQDNCLTIINQIVRPFIHICNVSFQTGVFPDKMKIA